MTCQHCHKPANIKVTFDGDMGSLCSACYVAIVDGEIEDHREMRFLSFQPIPKLLDTLTMICWEAVKP